MKIKVEKEGKKKTYNLIKSWEDVTLEKWVKLITFEKLSSTQEAMEVLGVLTDMPKKLIRELERIINLYKDRFHSNNKKKSIIIGATSTIIVALEANVDVIHICEDPVFEMYSEKLWKPLKVKKITNYRVW